MKTSELIGPALDWAVKKSINPPLAFPDDPDFEPPPDEYSTDWAAGGPIIERERMHLTATKHDGQPCWIADNPSAMVRGPTPLVAAMRCFVTSKLGDEVDVPEELTGREKESPVG